MNPPNSAISDLTHRREFLGQFARSTAALATLPALLNPATAFAADADAKTNRVVSGNQRRWRTAFGLTKTQGGHGSESRTGEIMKMITSYGSAAKPHIPALRELIASLNAEVARREFPGGELNNRRVGAVEEAIKTIEAAKDHPPLRSVTSAPGKTAPNK